MALSITHSYVSAVPDAGDASLVQPSDWNDTHDISGLAAGIEDFLATPSSANLKTAVTDETGSGALVFANTPTLVTPVLGAATGTSVVLSGKLEAASIELGHASANTLTASGGVLSIEGVALLSTASVIPLTVGTTTIASGTDTRILYNNAGVLGQYTLTGTGTVVAMQTAPSFLTSITTPIATITQGIITANAPQINGTVTWNEGSTVFTAWKLDVTSTASAAASLLMDLQVGSASKFWVKKNGNGALITTDGVGYNLFGTGSFGGSPTSTTAGVKIQLIYNDTNNRQFWIGGTDSGAFGLRLVSTTGSVLIDGDTTAIGGAPKLGFQNGFYVGNTSSGGQLISNVANSIEQRDGTGSQTWNHYDTWASSTDYHRLAIKTARATLASVNGATVTATSLIPDGAVVLGVTTKVTVAISGGGGTTGYQVGTVADPDRWGAAATITAGTSTDNTNWTAGTIECFTAASDVVITAVGGNFNGTGTIYVSVQYLIGQCD
jgi:hypothetical protein